MGQEINIKDKTFESFLSADEIAKTVSRLADNINTKYAGLHPVIIPVLEGSFMFAADLIKQVKTECEITFIKTASYLGAVSSGTVEMVVGLKESVAGRHVLIIEDIVDTGLTISEIINHLQPMNPASLCICTLLFKPEAFEAQKKPDFIGFEIPNVYVVGYGLDYFGFGRNHNEIYKLK